MANQFEASNKEDFDGYLRKPVLKAELINELCKFLPFAKMAEKDTSQHKLVLTDAELENLPDALEKLEKLIEQCKTASESNQMSTIKAFAETVKEVSTQYPVLVINHYSEQLSNAIDSFDIAAIKYSLNDYPKLIRRLQKTNGDNE